MRAAGGVLMVAAVIAISAALAAWAGWFALLLPGVVIIYALIAVSRATMRGAAAARAFRTAHPGKDLLFVHSNGADSKQHIEHEWLPRWGARAVVLNLSEREGGDLPSTADTLFRSVAGKREHNPVAIVIRPNGSIAVVRFWRALREPLDQRAQALRSAEAQLERALGARPTVGVVDSREELDRE